MVIRQAEREVDSGIRVGRSLVSCRSEVSPDLTRRISEDSTEVLENMITKIHDSPLMKALQTTQTQP